MAIAYDNSNGIQSSSVTSATTSSWTIASGSNTCLFGFSVTADASPTTHSGMEWQGSGGTALTQIGSTYSAGAVIRMSAWRLLAPTATTNTLYGNWAASQTIGSVGGASYSGVNQSSPTGTLTTNTGTVSNNFGFNATVDVTTTAGDIVIACVFIFDNNGSTPILTANNGTLRWKNEASINSMGIQEVTAVGATTTVSCAIAPTSSNISGDWGMIAFVINAASGVSGTVAYTNANDTLSANGAVVSFTPLMGQACL